jgi:hypothetical protein
MAGAGKNILGIFRLRFLVRQSTTAGPAVPYLTSRLTREPLVIARHRGQAIADWTRHLFTATFFR